MPPLPVLPGGEVVKVLEKLGFEVIRTKGSHHMMRNAEGRFTVVPVHPGRDLPVGTLRRIIRDTGLSIEEFVAML
ncbi:type II toxin-antitoxin system HicA family toxin [Frankia sp. AiPs1]|uniref:type II toxin-antitoxin system HicA family toxin n=1 Tax=Frankia sp. AiPs1 TaxID=573493 RepID=UPI0020439182|nr:type II toxin-antitoxin system HicA family toxin [Frankia sp. AiPs1]MCM3920339.1 type II toxin-antitoxin system HicA family toxin [Frankia sp. AiPs1]